MRRAKENDADLIAELDMKLFPENCFNEKTVRDLITDGESWVVYAHHSDVLFGYLIAARDGDLLDIVRIGVDPTCQSGGIGTMMLTALLGNDGPLFYRPAILTVRKENTRAIKLYKKFGFEIAGALVANDKESWVMSNRAANRG